MQSEMAHRHLLSQNTLLLHSKADQRYVISAPPPPSPTVGPCATPAVGIVQWLECLTAD